MKSFETVFFTRVLCLTLQLRMAKRIHKKFNHFIQLFKFWTSRCSKYASHSSWTSEGWPPAVQKKVILYRQTTASSSYFCTKFLHLYVFQQYSTISKWKNRIIFVNKKENLISSSEIWVVNNGLPYFGEEVYSIVCENIWNYYCIHM